MLLVTVDSHYATPYAQHRKNAVFSLDLILQNIYNAIKVGDIIMNTYFNEITSAPNNTVDGKILYKKIGRAHV